MTTTQDSMLVFKDQAGDYFAIPRETLERGRIPATHTAEIERVLAGATSAVSDDAEGYFWPIFVLPAVGAAVIAGGALYAQNNALLYDAIQEGLAAGGR
jgi:hypothetical protein